MFLDDTCSWAGKLLTLLTSDEDNNFDGSLVSDFKKWWRHVQPMAKNTRDKRGDAKRWMLFVQPSDNFVRFPNLCSFF